MHRFWPILLLLVVSTTSIGETPRKKRSFVLDLVNKVKPAIVTISAPDKDNKLVPLGLGAIVDKAGLIVTPRQLIEGKDNLEAALMDGGKLLAKVILSDAASGLAIVKVDSSKPLPFDTLADSAKVEVGDWVVGLGSFSKELSVDRGVISATNREVQGKSAKLLQWDSSIGPGSNSDMLINLAGEIVGIRIGGNRGVGLALPSNRVKEILAGVAKKK
jgi:serine protease Do